jgi:hypothetical protein
MIKKNNMETKVELIKETKKEVISYWVSINSEWSYCYLTLAEAEICYNLVISKHKENKIEVLKSTII